jgi:kinetochore protein NDC80
LESVDDPTLQIVDRIPEEFSDPIHHQALAFEYFSEAYVAFFHGADVFHEQDKALEASYGTSSTFSTAVLSDDRTEAKKNERVVSDLEDKKALLEQGTKELDELRASKVCRMYVYFGECRPLNINPLGTSGKTPENSGLYIG